VSVCLFVAFRKETSVMHSGHICSHDSLYTDVSRAAANVYFHYQSKLTLTFYVLMSLVQENVSHPVKKSRVMASVGDFAVSWFTC